MGNKTGIEWTDSTWSPIRARVKADAAEIARAKGYTSLVSIAGKMAGRVGQHCEHVSPGCEHCYAETNNHRCLPGNGTGLPYDRRSRYLVEAFVDEKVLMQPLRWKPCHWYDPDDGEVVGDRPRKIFVMNQSDLFAEWVTDEMRDRVCAVGVLSGHILQFLTKRPAEMLRYFNNPETSNRIQEAVSDLSDDYAYQWPYPNFWLGVSVENQAAADERIPLLLQTQAAVRFVSCEPLLGPINLNQEEIRKLDWVICGGESGARARMMKPEWARSLRDQCAATGTAFFMKQMGSVFGPSKGHELPDDLNIKQFAAARP